MVVRVTVVCSDGTEELMVVVGASVVSTDENVVLLIPVNVVLCTVGIRVLVVVVPTHGALSELDRIVDRA